jgi:glycerophosphoryl diester phosphodiesterase
MLNDRDTAPLVVAHRGASRLARENSLDAVQKAIDLGVDMVEIDVRRTRDGVFVLRHNATLRRRRVRAQPFEAMARADPQLATLEEILRCARGRTRLDIELKEAGHEAEVLDLIEAYLSPEAFVITSFALPVVETVKRLRPQVSTGWIVVERGARSELFARLAWAGAGLLAAHRLLVDRALLDAAATRGVEVAVWTVNRRAELDALLRTPGLGAVITDLPDVALALRARDRARP